MAFTYFFRDRLTLNVIQSHAIPELRKRRYVHIWDAGCAMGPEPYSLALMLRENVGEKHFRYITIHATDIDESNQFEEIITQGIYRRDQIKSVPEDMLAKYFHQENGSGYVQVKKEIRERIAYQKHDLLSLRPVRTNVSLVMCKNVLLHFQAEERIKVLTMFHQALEKSGFLVMEQTQYLPEEVSGLFEPVVSHARLYRKIAAETQRA
jgi:chemotaxis protein methyltransferase CheR